jgi:hypothetical protein
MHYRTISTFKANFLAKRGCSRATGEPLYSYRVAKDEFLALQSGLQAFLFEESKRCRLGEIAKRESWFPALFVLYSAEWWRREYDGSGWTWEPIVGSLGAPQDDWTLSRRSLCVETGLADWKIRLSNSGGFRYLGSIALQGGLPMKLLAAAQGNIGRVLTRVMHHAASSNVGESEIEEWVESLATYLPHTYRQTEIYRLLAQVITTVLALKRNAGLDSAEAAIAKLDATDPEWRNKFPLPIEDDQARGLLERLVKDAASVRAERKSAMVAVDRRLELVDAAWQIRSSVVIPEYATVAEINALFGQPKEAQLPRALVFRVSDGATGRDMGARRLAGRDQYRIDRGLPEFVDEAATREHVLSMILPDAMQRSTTLRKGDALHADLPWVFEDLNGTTAKFIRQGAGSVASPSAIMCVPYGWVVEAAEAKVDSLGESAKLMRTVWRFQGTIRVCDPAGATFRLRSGQASAEDDYLGWSGSRASDISFLSPDLAFRGTPRLCHFTEQGPQNSVNSAVSWRMGAQRELSSVGIVGPVEAIWPASGDVRWRSRIALLGDAKPIIAQHGEDPNSGTLCFPDWKLACVRSKTPHVMTTNEFQGTTLLATFKHTGFGSPPEWCEAELLWRGNPKPAQVRIPFPACGARCFDAKGRQLPNETLIATETVFGVRLVAFLGRTGHATLRFVLWDGHREADSTAVSIVAPVGTNRVEIRPVDHLSRIRRMLATADAIDAFVSVELDNGNSQPACLRVARYSSELEISEGMSAVSIPQKALVDLAPEDISKLAAEALRLDAPSEEPLRLSLPGNDPTLGVWHFPDERMDLGPWLIYPAKSSPVLFRPMLWTIRSEGDTALEGVETGLSSIANIADPHARLESLQAAIPKLAADFDHPDWGTVEQLADQLYHLPLCTLDLWRAFSRSPEGLAALALRTGGLPTGFLERFSTEMSCVWETIPLRTWVDEMRAFVVYRQRNPLLSSTISSRVEAIASLHPSLRALLEVAQTLCTGCPTDSVRFAQLGHLDFSKLLFVGDNSPFQNLLRDRAEASWPLDLKDEILRARATPVGRFFHPVDLWFREVVVNLPILLAAGIVTGQTGDWWEPNKLRTLRKYQDFCPEWFADAFDLTVARCISEKVIDGLGS